MARVAVAREGGVHQRHLLHAGFVAPSPFASSDSLTNDATRDHSDGIWNESQATVLQADERTAGSSGLLTPSSKRRHLLILQHQQRSSMDTDALDAEDEMDVYPSSPRIRLEAPTPVTTTSPVEATYTSTNGRARIGFLRRSPGPAAVTPQPHSQSSSEFGLSRSGTTDISETSTTDDYITANTSTGTGTTTGTATSSLTRPAHMHKAPSGPISATATQADGSSFESASSVYSLARSEAVPEDPSSPRTLKDKLDSPYSIQQQHQQQQQQQQSSPARSSSSSSSGSYDLEDAMPDTTQETFKPASHSAQATTTEQDIYDGHRSSSGGYAESPPDPHIWSEEERRRRKKTFTLDFPAGLEPTGGAESTVGGQPHPASHEATTTSLSPNNRERYRSRSKSAATRSSPHRNNKRRSFDSATLSQQQQQQMARSPQKEEWREPTEEAGHVPTSDDSSCSHPSCSHHYHVHHHHPHHHVHREGASESRHRRTRESSRRKNGGHLAARRRGSRDEVERNPDTTLLTNQPLPLPSFSEPLTSRPLPTRSPQQHLSLRLRPQV